MIDFFPKMERKNQVQLLFKCYVGHRLLDYWSFRYLQSI